MRERDAARAAQAKVGKGDWIPRPTKAEVLADVPGARNVKPELLPEGVQHLSNVPVGVVAGDPIGRRDLYGRAAFSSALKGQARW